MTHIGTALAGEISLPSSGGRSNRSGLRSLLRLARSKPLGAVSALILTLLVLAAVFAPVLTPYDPLSNNHSIEMQAPSTHHPFGTDQFGRDVLSRILFGARVSLEVGLGATIAGGVNGPTLEDH